jgi:hypothetical protein
VKVKAVFNTQQASKRLSGITAKAQKMVDAQILKDSNYFCKEDTGDLIRSGKVMRAGVLVWDERYAHEQYYLPKASKDKNPNAVYKWFEKAKATWLQTWVDMAQGAFGK